MKKLRFKELIILSLIEKSARKINLDADLTIVTSKDNDTGKSCLIKSIYYALGADIPNVHPTWNDINPITILHIDKDNKEYRVLRSEKLVVIFDEQNNVIEQFSSIGNDLALYYEEFFEFKLKLTHTSTKNMKTPFPAYYFLPFYIDQDAGWKKSWNSFDRLSAFSGWKPDLIDYHTGIKPNEYYILKSKKAKIMDAKSEKLIEYSTLNKMYLKYSNKSKIDIQVNLNVKEFKDQIDELMVRLNKLKQQEGNYKEQLLAYTNQVLIIDNQIKLAEKTRKELSKDLTYAEELQEDVECPLCGTVHLNDFAQRYAIAQDENRCYELMLGLQKDKDKVNKKIQGLKKSMILTQNEKVEIENILEYNQGEIKFKDYIECVGEKKLKYNIMTDLKKLNKEIDDCNVQISDIDEQMKKYIDGELKKEIEENYQVLMKKYLYKLNVHKLKEDVYKKMNCTIKETGSDLSRALLAYYFAILHVMRNYSSTYDCPIVIDSPLQDEQSEENIKKILEFIRDTVPSDAQLVLGCMSIDGVCQHNGDLILNGVTYQNANVIELKEQYHLLNKDNYEEILTEIKPFLNAALEV